MLLAKEPNRWFTRSHFTIPFLYVQNILEFSNCYINIEREISEVKSFGRKTVYTRNGQKWVKKGERNE